MSISFDFNCGIRKSHMFFHDVEYVKINMKRMNIKVKFGVGIYEYEMKYVEDIKICQ